MKINKLAYIIAKIKQKFISHDAEIISSFYRARGMAVGKNCIICDFLPVTEPELVSIGNDCVISSEVSLITHDHSINKVTKEGSNLFGKIVIGNNCFIGQRSILLYGVELADNIIVASGSVVTKSFLENNIIIGGNPAKVISSWEEFRKNSCMAANRNELSGILNGNIKKLIRR